MLRMIRVSVCMFFIPLVAMNNSNSTNKLTKRFDTTSCNTLAILNPFGSIVCIPTKKSTVLITTRHRKSTYNSYSSVDSVFRFDEQANTIEIAPKIHNAIWDRFHIKIFYPPTIRTISLQTLFGTLYFKDRKNLNRHINLHTIIGNIEAKNICSALHARSTTGTITMYTTPTHEKNINALSALGKTITVVHEDEENSIA